MKVKELIAILQTMPQDAIVTAYNTHEYTSPVTKKTVRYYKKGTFQNLQWKTVEKPHVDIMGAL